MDLQKAARDPWVWGQLALIGAVAGAAPLVTRGLYAYARHPIYGGLVLMLAGYTIAWADWTMGLIVGFVALQYFEAKARAEERWLVERYPEYRRYTLTVRRRVL